MIRSALLAALTLASAPAHLAASPICKTGMPHYRPRRVAPPPNAGYVTADGAVRITGYNDMAPMIGAWDTVFAADHPGVRFDLELKSTRSAPPALIAGRSAFAPMGAALTSDDLAAFRVATGGEPLVFRVAHDSLDPKALSGPLGLMVSQDNPLTSISLEQVARIFAAANGAPAIRTWGQLGLTGVWADRPIRPLGLSPRTALALFLQARVFPGRPYAPDLEGFGHSSDVVAALARDPLALGVAAVNTATPQVRTLAIRSGGRGPVRPTAATLRAGRYPLDRQLLIYARRPLDPWVREYLRLVLSCEGQAKVGAGGLGYLPLTPREVRAERRKLE